MSLLELCPASLHCSCVVAAGSYCWQYCPQANPAVLPVAVLPQLRFWLGHPDPYHYPLQLDAVLTTKH